MLAAHAPLVLTLRGENKGISHGQRGRQLRTTEKTGDSFVHKHPKLSTNEALVVHGIIPMGETSKGF